jgi:hypothetical protein
MVLQTWKTEQNKLQKTQVQTCPKLVPVIVSESWLLVEPAVEPDEGETVLIEGAKYENKLAPVLVVACDATVTVTPRPAPMPCGIVQRMLVCSKPDKSLQSTVPTKIVAEPNWPRLVPVMVSVSPPEVNADDGETDVMAGAMYEIGMVFDVWDDTW